ARRADPGAAPASRARALTGRNRPNRTERGRVSATLVIRRRSGPIKTDHVGAMQAERARERLTSLATVGLDLPAFVDAALAVLRPALPFGSACVSTVDPATELLTGTIKSD